MGGNSGINVFQQQCARDADNMGRGWNVSVIPYEISQPIDVVENCFAIMFTNIGDTPARLNGMVVFPSATPATALGDSRTLSGHWLDIYKGNLRLAFDFPANAAPLIEIVQFFYTTPIKIV